MEMAKQTLLVNDCLPWTNTPNKKKRKKEKRINETEYMFLAKSEFVFSHTHTTIVAYISKTGCSIACLFNSVLQIAADAGAANSYNMFCFIISFLCTSLALTIWIIRSESQSQSRAIFFQFATKRSLLMCTKRRGKKNFVVDRKNKKNKMELMKRLT